MLEPADTDPAASQADRSLFYFGVDLDVIVQIALDRLALSVQAMDSQQTPLDASATWATQLPVRGSSTKTAPSRLMPAAVAATRWCRPPASSEAASLSPHASSAINDRLSPGG
jgi:hypothetical protein